MKRLESFGFVRVGAAVPRLKVADCAFNSQRIIELMEEAQRSGISILVFPELCITGYTCQDLFQQAPLLNGAIEGLESIRAATKSKYKGLLVVGMPIAADDQLFNCAVAVHDGKILGAIPKSYNPNYKEFYEKRWFSSSENSQLKQIRLCAEEVPFGIDVLFEASDCDHLIVGAEICEDLWVPIPPSCLQALSGATVLLNLSASNELIGKCGYRRQLVSNQSARCFSAYAYSSCGTGESSTDLVFSGHCLVAENGVILSENSRFERESVLQFADIDLQRLMVDRWRANTFADNKRSNSPHLSMRRIAFNSGAAKQPEQLSRAIDAHPFVPRGKEQLADRCNEIFHIQVAALSKRLESVAGSVSKLSVAIGVSGGLDSTLALLVLCKTADLLGVPRAQILAYTLPGFGTTSRTKSNAIALMEHLGVQSREIDIKALCFDEMKELKHKPFGIDIQNMSLKQFIEKLKDLPAGSQDFTFENVQARMRTSILMNAGFVVGTGDLSELALGWCTYNADHMSMYNPNVSIPKTLVKFLVDWVADHEFDGETRKTLKDIVDTEISPELLPPCKEGKITQKTETAVGPYELNDFFLFHVLRFGMTPEKIFYLAKHADFDGSYSDQEILKWLKLFVRRFFNSQFKRSCLPDGPKVGSVSLSPRGDWRMPSDAQASAWMAWLDEVEKRDSLDNDGGRSRRLALPLTGRNEQDAPAGVVHPARVKQPSNEKRKRALLLVDPLNGFGSATHNDGNGHCAELPVEGGEEVGPPIGRLQEKGSYHYCIAGVDQHPVDMFNFASQCPGKVPYKDRVPDKDGELAVVYPDHCQKGSWSAGFLPGIREDLIDEIFPKGNERDKDSHSACGNPNLIPYLKERGITDVDLAGLVYRICVGLTAIDLAKAGFNVRVVTDCTRDLDIPQFSYVIRDMKKLGVKMVSSEEVLAGKPSRGVPSV